MSRLLLIGLTAFIVASLSIFFFGDSGLTSLRSWSQYERSLSANVDDLKRRNEDLQARLQLLKTDRQSIVIMAREIGMYEPGDAVVKLVGRAPKAPLYVMGDLLRMRRQDSERNAIFKETALVATLVFLLLAFIAARVARAREKRNGSTDGNGSRRRSSSRIRSSLVMQKITPFESHGAGRR